MHQRPSHPKHPKHHKRGNVPPRQPIYRELTPSQPGSGLDSVVNKQFVLRTLQCSTRQQIEEVLRQIGFTGGSGRPANPPHPQANGAATVEARSALESPAGRSLLEEQVQKLARAQAERELGSPSGMAAVAEIKAKLIAGQVANDPAAFPRLCQRELTKQVDRWLFSEHGQEMLAAERERVVRRLASQSRPSRWLQRPTTDNHTGNGNVE